MNLAYAECSRSDIDYYLSKGFTTDQITDICKVSAPSPTVEPSKSSTNEEHSDKKKIAPLISAKPTSNKDEKFFRESIKGRDIILTDNSLQYTLKTCIEYGDEDLYGFAPKACPKVRYEIALEGLEVIKSGKKYLIYGDEEVHVKGNIKREVIKGLEKLKPEERELFLKKLNLHNQTIIPVRDDVTADSVKQVLLDLSL
jgi:hypothetical protein